jgi:serine/threonine protein kinase/tetratricopeptide (TPR) repeat protein
LPDSTPTLTPGARLGSYEIESALGAGGMGEVYRARDLRLNRQVAIKVLPRASTADPHARERLRREAMAVAAIDHPYICKIFELGEEGDALFLVMEYIAGETLHSRLREGALPLSDTLRIAGEIAEALHEAHTRGFLHRDLKPANIILTGQGHVKVMDFGLARRVEELASPDQATRELEAAQLTVRGTIVGTPDYMSPEQAKGLALDSRSDLFSFGVMLAEMTGGHHPFRQSSTAETLSAVLREPPDLRGDLPSGLADVVRRLLAKRPEDRYPSAADVRADLARLPLSSADISLSSRARGNGAAGKPLTWSAAVLGLALGAYLIARSASFRTAAPAAGSATPIRSIAVLPLDNYSGDSKEDYFAEGMTDELTANLATISQLRVISRGSAMQFKGGARPPTPDIAAKLHVDAVIEGSVTRSGDKVRITAQLIDARADKHLWAKTFERSSLDVLALQAELASAIAREVNVRLTSSEEQRLTAVPSVSPEAHDAYLKGRYFFNRPSDENLQKAIAQFEESVRLSPGFAPALSGMSDAYLWAGYNEGFLTASEARPKAKATAEKAVQLNDQSAEAHTSLGVFKLFYEHDWAGCEREFRRALTLNPNYAFAHDQFGMALAFQGRFDEAIGQGKRAIELDPLSPQVLIDATLPFLFQRNTATARELARKAVDLDPMFFFPVMIDGWADLEIQAFREAIPALKKARSMDAPPFVTAYLAFGYGAAGDRESALRELAELHKMSPDGNVLPFNLALVYLGLGDHARTLDGLERALAADSQAMVWIGRDTIFDPIRSEPRFEALVKKIGLNR